MNNRPTDDRMIMRFIHGTQRAPLLDLTPHFIPKISSKIRGRIPNTRHQTPNTKSKHSQTVARLLALLFLSRWPALEAISPQRREKMVYPRWGLQCERSFHDAIISTDIYLGMVNMVLYVLCIWLQTTTLKRGPLYLNLYPLNSLAIIGGKL